MRRHIAWILWLVAAVLTYATLGSILSMLSDRARTSADDGAVWGLLALLCLLLMVVAPLVMVGISLACALSCFRRWRRRRGRYTKAERAMIARQEQSADWWRYAARRRQALLAGQLPEARANWEVVLHDDERLCEEIVLDYARYYGTDVYYTQTSSFAFGHPAFVLSALAVNAAANAASARNASAAAAPQWRERQTCRVLITNRRLLAHANGQWLSFWFSGITAIYPEAAARTLVCQFESGEPLMLSGDAAPLAAVYAVLIAQGPEALEKHPSVVALNALPGEPELPRIGRERRSARTA